MASDIEAGLRNLLDSCAELSAGKSMLVVREDPALGWYDDKIADAVQHGARERGVAVAFFDVAGPQNTPVPGLSDAVAAHDVVLFLARVGDQGRFEEPFPGKTAVMSYCRDVPSLASPYGWLPHAAMQAMKQAINRTLLDADRIRISCPLGTDLEGCLTPEQRQSDVDVGMRRFPMGIHQPLPAQAFSGTVAVTHFLTPTGSRVYEPPAVPIEGTVHVTLDCGRITVLAGPEHDVALMWDHHQRVAAEFGIDPNLVHSWHAGIHPACDYPRPAGDNPDRWSNNAFTNPRLLHFHTCCDAPPGEICWMVADPTIEVDGAPLWKDGAIQAAQFPKLQDVLQAWPALEAQYRKPSQAIGL